MPGNGITVLLICRAILMGSIPPSFTIQQAIDICWTGFIYRVPSTSTAGIRHVPHDSMAEAMRRLWSG